MNKQRLMELAGVSTNSTQHQENLNEDRTVYNSIGDTRFPSDLEKLMEQYLKTS